MHCSAVCKLQRSETISRGLVLFPDGGRRRQEEQGQDPKLATQPTSHRLCTAHERNAEAGCRVAPLDENSFRFISARNSVEPQQRKPRSKVPAMALEAENKLRLFRRLQLQHADWMKLSQTTFSDSASGTGTLGREALAKLLSVDDVHAADLHVWLDANGDGQVCAEDFDERVLKPLFAEEMSAFCQGHCDFVEIMAEAIPRQARSKGFERFVEDFNESKIEEYVQSAVPRFVRRFNELCSRMMRQKLQPPDTEQWGKEPADTTGSEKSDGEEGSDLSEVGSTDRDSLESFDRA
eukprot:2072576-Rhodomonas_salina.1